MGRRDKGSYWLGSPCTYGFGVGFADNWGIGFGFGFGAGEWLGTWSHPWWGPYDWGWRYHFDYNHVSLNHVNIYHHWGPGVVQHVQHNYGFNAWNGREWSHNWSTHFNPYSSRAFDHTGVARFGAYHGNFQAHVPVAPVAPRAFDQHNIYSGRDGSIYRYHPSGTWERNTGQSWQRAPAAPRANLEQHAFGRNMGQQRFNNFRSSGAFAHPGGGVVARPGGGGGHVGGGGHR